MTVKISREVILKRIFDKHGSKYDCSEIQWNTLHDYVEPKCFKHGKFRITLNNLLIHGCKSCMKESFALSLEEFKQKAVDKHGNEFDYSLVVYVNHMTKVKIIHNKCKNMFEQMPNKHLAGQKCPFCMKNRRLNTEMFIELGKIVHGEDRYTFENTIFVRCIDKVLITCHKQDKSGSQHGDFLVTPSNFMRHRGCPICKESYGEGEVRKYLKIYKILFKYNFRFEDCRDKRELPFDFYLPEYNICMEYQGIQHYGITLKNFQITDKQFESNRKRDQIKRDYCYEKGIKLIEIPYWDFKNIKSILIKELNLGER